MPVKIAHRGGHADVPLQHRDDHLAARGGSPRPRACWSAGLALTAHALPAGAPHLRQLHGQHLLPLVDGAPLGRGGLGDGPGRAARLPPDPPLRGRPGGDGEVAVRHRRPHLHRGHPRHGPPLLLGRGAELLAPARRVLQRARAARVPRHGDLRLHGHAALGHRASEPARRSTGPSAAPSSPPSAPGSSASRTPGRRSTGGRTAR